MTDSRRRNHYFELGSQVRMLVRPLIVELEPV